MRRSISQTLVRVVVIVFGDPFSDRRSRLLHAAVLVDPNFFLLQAAMKTFDVAVAFRMMIRRSAVGDAQPRKRFDVTRRVNCVPLSVVNVSSAPRLPRGKRASTACSTASMASSLRQRNERFHPMISRVQQSITLTRYAHPTAGPAHTLVMSDCQI